MSTLELLPEETFGGLLEKNKRMLHLGGDIKLKELTEPSEYVRIEIDQLGDFQDLPKGFDYVVISDVLELIDNPLDLIKHVKNLATTTVIYEFKYEEEEWVLDPAWKKPWLTVGLDWNISKNFDYINDIFLGYATIHICSMPYNGPEDTSPNDIK